MADRLGITVAELGSGVLTPQISEMVDELKHLAYIVSQSGRISVEILSETGLSEEEYLPRLALMLKMYMAESLGFTLEEMPGGDAYVEHAEYFGLLDIMKSQRDDQENAVEEAGGGAVESAPISQRYLQTQGRRKYRVMGLPSKCEIAMWDV